MDAKVGETVPAVHNIMRMPEGTGSGTGNQNRACPYMHVGSIPVRR